MNTLCVHSLVWASRWSDDEGHRAIERAAAAGFGQIVIPLGDLSAVHPDRTAKALAAAGIEAANGLVGTFEADISSDDPDIAARGEKRIADAIPYARDLGSKRIAGVYYSALGKYDRPPTATGRRRAVEALARLGARAKAAGVTLALEAVSRYDTNLLNTGAQVMELIAEAGSDALAVHLDTFHMNIEETSPAAAVRACAPRLGFVEFGESHRGYLGTGTIDFAPIFRAVAETGYQGPLGFEAFSSGTLAPAGVAMVGAWRRMWDDPDDLARRARAFIDAGLAAARLALAYPR